MTGRTDVTVRVDADSRIGLGHLKRCLSLAHQFRRDGCRVRFVGRQRFGPQIESLAEGFPVLWLDDGDGARSGAASGELWDAERTVSLIGAHPAAPSVVLVDHYELGELWERRIGQAGHIVVAIDDMRDRRHCAAMVIGSVEGLFDPRLNSYAGEARILAGSQYAIVDREFACSESSSPVNDGESAVLVCYGGADPTNETIKAVQAIQDAGRDQECRVRLGRIDIVVGHANPRLNEVRACVAVLSRVRIHVAPESLGPLMRQAGIVLTSAGNTMIEALTMRKPCVVTQTGDNQTMMVDYLLAQGAIRFVGRSESVARGNLAEAIASMLKDYTCVAEAARARSVFDHHGARRISSAIQSMLVASAAHPCSSVSAGAMRS